MEHSIHSQFECQLSCLTCNTFSLLADDRSENTFSYYEFLQHLKTQVKWMWEKTWQRMCMLIEALQSDKIEPNISATFIIAGFPNKIIFSAWHSAITRPDSACVCWNSIYVLACVHLKAHGHQCFSAVGGWLYQRWGHFALVASLRSILQEGSPESHALWVTDCLIF